MAAVHHQGLCICTRRGATLIEKMAKIRLAMARLAFRQMLKTSNTPVVMSNVDR